MERRRDGDAFLVREGWTGRFDAGGLSPSAPGRFRLNPGDLRSSGEPLRLSIEAVLAGVRWSMERADRAGFLGENTGGQA